MNAEGQTLQRAAALAAAFAEIERTRMVGVPLLNPRLQVQAVGFEPLRDARAAPEVRGPHGVPAGHGLPDVPASALGILLTPWFMNLVWLPLERSDAAVRPDQRRLRQVGAAEIEFTVASEAAVGAFECCSLFSPMFEFGDQASAVATAVCVLDELRQAEPVAQPQAALPQRPARRAFLFGRAGLSP